MLHSRPVICFYAAIVGSIFLFVSALISAEFNTTFAQASTTPTPTPSPTPTPIATSPAAWFSKGHPRTPTGLQRTASTALGGGGGDEFSCTYGYFPGAAPQPWFLSDEQISLIAYPTYKPEETRVWLWTCPTEANPRVEVQLVWPDGRKTMLAGKLSKTISTPEVREIYLLKYEISFRHDMPAGNYLIQVSTDYGIFSRRINFLKPVYLDSVYYGSRFVIRDSASGAERYEFRPGDVIEIEYSKYLSDTLVEVGLYFYNNPSYQYELLNSWIFQVDGSGTHRERLEVPAEALPGEYILVAGESDIMDTRFLGAHLGGVIPDFFLSNGQHYFQLPFTLSDSSASVPPLEDAESVAASPLDTATLFYAGLHKGVTSGDFYDAYNLMSRGRRAQRSYEELRALYADTGSVVVEQIELIAEDERSATVQVTVALTISANGRTRVDRYKILYNLIKEDGQWRMDTFRSTRL